MRNFQGRTPCRHCGAKGFIEIEIDIDEFINMIENADNKIVAIKAVRTRWDIGLKDAKDIVEAYQEFLNSIGTIMKRG